tara:strand:+ start:6604 stop:8079 length:1476 start_codon:yes stop_codon:yes gene_type:complete
MPLLLSKLRKAALDQDVAPVLITVAVSAMLAMARGGLSVSLSLLIALIIAMQVALKLYLPFYEKAIPIEWLERGGKRDGAYFPMMALALSPVPVLEGALSPLGWLVTVFVAAWLVPPFYRLAIRLRGKGHLWKQHLEKVRDHRPLVAVHVSGTAGSTSGYQINQWLPVLEQLDVPVVVILRERGIAAVVAETALPILYVRNAAHVEQVLETGIRTVLYPANPMKNIQLFRHFRINHFFINHGESDKAVNQSKFLMAYDKILVGGPLAERRLRQAGLPVREGQVEHVGRPQAEMLLQRRQGTAPIQTILYAPTWEGFKESVDYSSIGRFSARTLSDLWNSNHYRILIKPHPYSGVRDKAKKIEVNRLKHLCEKNGHEFLDPESSILDAMNRSDLLITDISSVLNDYLVTGKPIVLCVTDKMAGVDLAEEFPSSRAAYTLPYSQDPGALELIRRIDEHDALHAAREEIRADSLGSFEHGALKRFKEVVERSVS